MTDVHHYGQSPVLLSEVSIEGWEEFMHYLYLPVHLPGEGFRLPPRLEFAAPLIERAVLDYALLKTDISEVHVYLTARRGFASPADNPINRPGWHTDGFGTEDINYIWCDRWPTRVAVQPFRSISRNHVTSAQQFEEQVEETAIREIQTEALYRMNPFVVHTTPIVPHPGGMRSFLKISFSRHRYNLIGNSHNYLFDYDWEMFRREDIRNDPNYAGGDYR